MRQFLIRLAAVLAAGAATGLGFPPHGLFPLVPVGVAVLSLAVAGTRARQALLLGTAFGFAFMLVLLPWLQVIGPDAWIALSLVEGLFYGLLGVGLAVVRRLPLWPVWGACLWVADELARGTVPWGGFPWGRLAFATADTPVAPMMRLVGAGGTTFVIALVGTTLAWAVLRVRAEWSGPTTLRRLAGAPMAVAAALGLATLPAMVWPAASTGSSSLDGMAQIDLTDTVRLAAVQGDVPGEGMDAFAERRAVLDNHVAATLDLAARVDAGATERPDMVLWPENSTDIDPFADPTVYRDIQRAVDAVGVPVLVGAMVGGPGPVDVRNQGIVWSPGTGPGESYSKMHPVPFGEYIPHRAQLATLFERLDQIPRDMVPGTEPGILEIAGRTVGDVICFEVAYDGVVHDVVRGGAGFLVVQTNNATYMGTGQVEQQFAIARLRAIETGRWVVVVATNGVSGVVAPNGTVTQRAPVRTTTVLEAVVPVADGLTPALRVGRPLDAGLTVAGLAAVGLGLLRRRHEGDAGRGNPREARRTGPGGHEMDPSRPGGRSVGTQSQREPV